MKRREQRINSELCLKGKQFYGSCQGEILVNKHSTNHYRMARQVCMTSLLLCKWGDTIFHCDSVLCAFANWKSIIIPFVFDSNAIVVTWVLYRFISHIKLNSLSKCLGKQIVKLNHIINSYLFNFIMLKNVLLKIQFF